MTKFLLDLQKKVILQITHHMLLNQRAYSVRNNHLPQRVYMPSIKICTNYFRSLHCRLTRLYRKVNLKLSTLDIPGTIQAGYERKIRPVRFNPRLEARRGEFLMRWSTNTSGGDETAEYTSSLRTSPGEAWQMCFELNVP